MADEKKHVPYNTAPMSLEEREKELAKSGSGTPLKQEQAKSKRPSTESLVADGDETAFEKQRKQAKKANKAKAKMAGGDEPT